MSKPTPIPLRSIILLPIVCFGLAFLLSRTAFVTQLGWQSLDLRTQLRTRFQPPPDPRIAIVLYENQTDSTMAPWPPDRAWHAQFMKLLFQTSPALIAWDVIFDADGKLKEGETVPGGDQEMADVAQALSEAGVPILIATFATDDEAASLPGENGPTRPLAHVVGDLGKIKGDKRAFLPFSALRKVSQFSFSDCPPGPDGIRRAIPLVVRFGDQVYPTIGLQTSMQLLKVKPEDATVTLGRDIRFSVEGKEWRIPINAAGELWVNYRYDSDDGKAPTFPFYSYAKLLFALNDKFVDEKPGAEVPDLKGKIVLVGQTVTGKADAGPTPLGEYSPLTLYHANVINNILRQDFVRFVPDWFAWLGGITGTILVFLYSVRKSAWWLIVLVVSVLFLHSASCTALWIKWSIWLPWLGPSLGFAISGFSFIALRFRQELKAKEKIKGMFGSYLSPDLLTKMTAAGSSLEIRSERRPVTILFTDLRNFTAWSEKITQDVLISQLNEYLAVMVQCIHSEQGTLHKFIGDAVMAAWGDLSSISPSEDAARACRAALLMQRRLSQLNEQWTAAGRHTLQMGIGINHGVVLVGNIGCPQRMEFTVIGDPVNLASRLESLNKEMKTSILVGEDLRALVADQFEFRPLGEVPVKGKSKAVAIFELRGELNLQSSHSLV
ncbi:MAG: adenylate/guanylate cyclase domain-containing protein [Opitutaceae bacterium]|jgi:adenylate cyclase